MREFIGILVAGLLGTSVLFGQTTAYTDPVGYYMVAVPGASESGEPAHTYVGVQLEQKASWVSGVDGVAGNTVTVFGGNLTPGAFDPANQLHLLYAPDGDPGGFLVDIVSNTESTITCAEDVTPWLSPGDQIFVRPHWTIQGLMGDEHPLTPGTSPEDADLLVLWDAPTQTERIYFFHSEHGEWRREGSEEDQGNTPIRTPNGFKFVRKTSGDRIFVISGHVPVRDFLIPVWPGRNLLSVPIRGSTLNTSSYFEEGSPYSIIGGPSAPLADTLTFHEPGSGEIKGPYYYREGGLGSDGWRRVGASFAGDEEQHLLGAVILDRRGAAGRMLVRGYQYEDPNSGPAPPQQTVPSDVTMTVEQSPDLVAWETVPDGDPFNLKSNELQAGQFIFYRIKVVQ